MSPLIKFTAFMVAMLGLFLSWSATAQIATTKTNDVYESIAVARGWVTNYMRGREIIRELSAVSPERREKPWTDKYRGEKVAFAGATAPPGTEDLLTEGGFYLRVLYPKGKEAASRNYFWHEIMVNGTILRVYPANSLIVIQVDEEQLIQSG
jgi:hypothetical protein